jgi:hypothetical protein
MQLARSFRWLPLALVVTIVPLSSQAGIFISVGFAPPVLPVYVQPVCPQPGLMWTPGYWAYGDDGYYWVPGAWVPSPYVGALWTPGYWGWGGGLYAWHAGYWGPHIGYYGGVNYGFGYGGIGFAGGMWRGGFFAYNTAVMHVGVGGGWGNRTYVDNTIIQRNTIVNNNHVSYNGGPGGIDHQPAPEERVAEHDQHTGPTSFQAQHENTFRNDHTAYAKVNGGHPQQTAISRPLAAENHTPPNSFQNHTSPQTNAHPMGESVNHSNAPSNPRPMARSESVNHGNPPANPRPMERSENVNHNPGGGNPHPNNASTPHPAPHAESKPAPQAHPKPEEKERPR